LLACAALSATAFSTGNLTAQSPAAAAFRDAFPVSQGHTLVVPRRHAASIYTLDAAEQAGRVHGSFPPRALRLVQEWANLHQAELLANWERAARSQPLLPIEPLE
jgi:hypothetical protein